MLLLHIWAYYSIFVCNCLKKLHLIFYFQNGDHHEKNKSNLYDRTRQPER